MAGVVLIAQNALNNADQAPVLIEELVTLSKLDKMDVRNTKRKPEFSIIFLVDTGWRRKIEWRYDDEECRDADFNRVINELSQPES